MERTPSTRVRVVDRGVDIAKIDLAHEAIDLKNQRVNVRVAGKEGTPGRACGDRGMLLTLSCREKDAKRD